MMTTSAKPFLFSIPLDADRKDHALVIVHRREGRTPRERLISVTDFADDGRGGFIAAAQTSGQRWGYINQSGRWVVPPTLDAAKGFSEDGLARFQQDGRWGYVNTAGEVVIAAQFEDARAFCHGLAAVQTGKEQWRFIDVAGRFAFEHVFPWAGDFSGAGLAPATAPGKGRLNGYIDRTGLWVIEPQFKTALAFGAEGVAPASTDLKKYGLIDTTGCWVLAPVYRRIEQFNADGLAYFNEDKSWTDAYGYLNARGEAVIKGCRELSDYMAGGIVAVDYAGRAYSDKEGRKLPTPDLSWGSHFNASGYAVARTKDAAWSDTLQQYVPLPCQWGLLHADGTFRPVPGEVLEPLTDAKGWIAYPPGGTPFAPFLTKSGGIVFLDREGAVAFRVRYDNQAALLDAQENVLWQSDMGQGGRRPAPFFERTLDEFLDGVAALDDTVACAESMLAETEEKLHCFANGEPLAEREEDDGFDEAYDDAYDDEATREENSIVTVRRLVRAYVGAEHNAYYGFLREYHRRIVAAAGTVCRSALQARFGEPDPDPEHASRHPAHAGLTCAWPVQLRQPIAGAPDALPEAGELWLGFYAHDGAGDGDVWHELWLMCAPSIDALQAAARARASAVPQAGSPHGGRPVQSPPRTYDEWLDAVREDRYAIAQAPSALIDDEMADAAVAADAAALEYVPAPWQTPARLDALIRQGVAAAVAIPPQCMTAEGLALARALYGGEREWQWHDEKHAALPAEWDHNGLHGVWGALLTEELCIRAVTGGAALRDVPHWLRTEKVEEAALAADLDNINDIAREKITPELITRFIRRDYASLLRDLPEQLLTPQACMVTAGMNGMSLERLPVAMRSAEACLGALLRDRREFAFVPEAVRLDVCTGLIEVDLMRAMRAGNERTASRWHGYRAWVRLQRADHEGAVADATLAIDGMGHASDAHYVLASAYLALGRRREAALEASTVLSLDDAYTCGFDEQEDTSWLKPLARDQFDGVDDAELLARLQSHPLALADMPRARLTHELVDAALAADAGAIAFVPKRLMTAQRYAIALRQGTKRFGNIPQALLSEESCIEHVRTRGFDLKEVPVEWRTVRVCAHALKNQADAVKYVPEPIRSAAQEATRALPVAAGEDD